MPYVKCIVFAFISLGKSGDSVFLAKRLKIGRSARNKFMRIALVTDIENKPVRAEIEAAM